MEEHIFDLFNEEEFMGSVSERQQQSSVRHLQALYAIVSGLALTEAVSELARETENQLPTLRTVMLMAAFLATIMPFFHGGLRHLDEDYLIEPKATMKRFALPVDFVLLFVESVLVLGMAHRLANPAHFLAFLVFLLVVDIVWAFVMPLLIDCSSPREVFASFWSGRRFSQDPEIAWGQNNVLFLVVAILAWIAIDNADWGTTTDAAIVMIFALARTANDYRVSWPFYFPRLEQAPGQLAELVNPPAPAESVS
jgi:hypothetical protein